MRHYLCAVASDILLGSGVVYDVKRTACLRGMWLTPCPATIEQHWSDEGIPYMNLKFK